MLLITMQALRKNTLGTVHTIAIVQRRLQQWTKGPRLKHRRLRETLQAELQVRLRLQSFTVIIIASMLPKECLRVNWEFQLTRNNSRCSQLNCLSRPLINRSTILWQRHPSLQGWQLTTISQFRAAIKIEISTFHTKTN